MRLWSGNGAGEGFHPWQSVMTCATLPGPAVIGLHVWIAGTTTCRLQPHGSGAALAPGAELHLLHQGLWLPAAAECLMHNKRIRTELPLSTERGCSLPLCCVHGLHYFRFCSDPCGRCSGVPVPPPPRSAESRQARRQYRGSRLSSNDCCIMQARPPCLQDGPSMLSHVRHSCDFALPGEPAWEDWILRIGLALPIFNSGLSWRSCMHLRFRS